MSCVMVGDESPAEPKLTWEVDLWRVCGAYLDYTTEAGRPAHCGWHRFPAGILDSVNGGRRHAVEAFLVLFSLVQCGRLLQAPAAWTVLLWQSVS